VLSDGLATYQYGLGLLGETRGGASKFFHLDSLGTARALSDASGAKSDGLETDAFGMVVSTVGTPVGARPFGFASGHGYQSDADTGLQRLGHRFYDPATGRFLSRDPIQAGDNWYAYCQNDPVNKVDPEGLEGEDDQQGNNKSGEGKPPKDDPYNIYRPSKRFKAKLTVFVEEKDNDYRLGIGTNLYYDIGGGSALTVGIGGGSGGKLGIGIGLGGGSTFDLGIGLGDGKPYTGIGIGLGGGTQFQIGVGGLDPNNPFRISKPVKINVGFAIPIRL
jgi:RHS repeat-associated protein